MCTEIFNSSDIWKDCFLTLKLRALWVAGCVKKKKKRMQAVIFQKFLTSYQVADYHHADNVTNVLSHWPSNGAEQSMGFPWGAGRAMGWRGAGAGTGALGAQHQLPAVFYPSLRAGLEGAGWAPPGSVLVKITRTDASLWAGGGAAVRALHEPYRWCSETFSSQPRGMTVDSSGLHRDAGFFLHMVTLRHNVLFQKKPMDTFQSTDSFSIFYTLLPDFF